MAQPLLIVGLGNPGAKYAATRHNAGSWFLEAVIDASGATLRPQARLGAESARVRWHERDCIVARPTTFMNQSGRPVRALLDYFRVSPANMLVAYDELDLPPGTVRLKVGGGHGGHNGLRDIFAHVPDRDFMRLRIGIGHPGVRDRVVGYVLSRPSADDEALIRDGIGRALDVMPRVLAEDVGGAMKELHTAQAGDG